MNYLYKYESEDVLIDLVAQALLAGNRIGLKGEKIKKVDVRSSGELEIVIGE